MSSPYRDDTSMGGVQHQLDIGHRSVSPFEPDTHDHSFTAPEHEEPAIMTAPTRATHDRSLRYLANLTEFSEDIAQYEKKLSKLCDQTAYILGELDNQGELPFDLSRTFYENSEDLCKLVPGNDNKMTSRFRDLSRGLHDIFEGVVGLKQRLNSFQSQYNQTKPQQSVAATQILDPKTYNTLRYDNPVQAIFDHFELISPVEMVNVTSNLWARISQQPEPLRSNPAIPTYSSTSTTSPQRSVSAMTLPVVYQPPALPQRNPQRGTSLPASKSESHLPHISPPLRTGNQVVPRVIVPDSPPSSLGKKIVHGRLGRRLLNKIAGNHSQK